MGLFIDGNDELMDANDERLERRYIKAPRRYPLAGEHPIVERIRLERQVAFSLRNRADLVIDTSLLTAPDLKRLLTIPVALDAGRLRVFVTSVALSPG